MNQAIKYGKSRLARSRARQSYSVELISIRRIVEIGTTGCFRAGIAKVG